MNKLFFRCKNPQCEEYGVQMEVNYIQADRDDADNYCSECTCQMEVSSIPFQILTQDLSWKPGDDYAIRLKAVSDEPLTEAQLNEMVDKVGDVVEEYGFKPGSWGSLRGIVYVFRKAVD